MAATFPQTTGIPTHLSPNAANNGSGAVGDPPPGITLPTLTAPEAENFAIFGPQEIIIPMLDDTSSTETRIDSIRICLTQLRDAVATPGRFTQLLQFWHSNTLERSIEQVNQQQAVPNQQISDELTHLKSTIAGFRVQIGEQTKKTTLLEEKHSLLEEQIGSSDAPTRNDRTIRPNNQSLLEAKSVNTLKILGDKGIEFKPWIENFEQVMSELRPYLSEIIEWICKDCKTEVTKERFEDKFSTTKTPEEIIELWDKTN